MKKAIIFMLVFLMTIATWNIAYAEEMMIATGSANVRKFPGIDADIIGVLDKGKTIIAKNYISTNDGRTWVQVDWYGQDGFISDKNLHFSDSEEDGTYYIYNSSVKMHTTGNVNVRYWAGIDSPVYAVWPKDTKLDVWGFCTTNDGCVWAEVLIDNVNYIFGYVSTMSLEYEEVGRWPELRREMYVTGGTVNVRESASIDSKILKVLKVGDVVVAEQYVPTSDGRIWCSCLKDGKNIGWISVRYLEPVY